MRLGEAASRSKSRKERSSASRRARRSGNIGRGAVRYQSVMEALALTKRLIAGEVR